MSIDNVAFPARRGGGAAAGGLNPVIPEIRPEEVKPKGACRKGNGRRRRSFIYFILSFNGAAPGVWAIRS
jgi:hypothetical protein